MLATDRPENIEEMAHMRTCLSKNGKVLYFIGRAMHAVGEQIEKTIKRSSGPNSRVQSSIIFLQRVEVKAPVSSSISFDRTMTRPLVDTRNL